MHGFAMIVGAAPDALADPAIARVVVSDSVPAFRWPAHASSRGKLQVVGAAPLLACAIGESLESAR